LHIAQRSAPAREQERQVSGFAIFAWLHAAVPADGVARTELRWRNAPAGAHVASLTFGAADAHLARFVALQDEVAAGL